MRTRSASSTIARSVRTVAALAAIAALAGGAGCAKKEKRYGGFTEEQLRQIESRAGGGFASPSVMGSVNGLEVVWFVSRDDAGQVAQALRPYMFQPVPVSDATAERLRENGLRLVRVPLADLQTLYDTLPTLGIRQRRWLGWALQWSEAFEGRALRAPRTARLDGAAIDLPTAATRLLVRSWTTPTPEGPRLRFSLATQLLPPPSPRAEFDLSTRAGAAPDDEISRGPLVDALCMEATLRPGYAYVLTAESPGADWGERESSDDDLDPAALAAASGLDLLQDMVSPAETLGPVAPALRTLGEEMLVSDDAARDGPYRAIIAFIPRLPERVDLLGVAQAQ